SRGPCKSKRGLRYIQVAGDMDINEIGLVSVIGNCENISITTITKANSRIPRRQIDLLCDLSRFGDFYNRVILPSSTQCGPGEDHQQGTIHCCLILTKFWLIAIPDKPGTYIQLPLIAVGTDQRFLFRASEQAYEKKQNSTPPHLSNLPTSRV